MTTSRRRAVARWMAAGLVIGVGACATSRYVGSVGRDGTYANRGYGFALRLHGLSQRWTLLDPAKLPLTPTPGLPVPSRGPLDFDADGMLSVGESALHFDPVVRLESRTSTGARVDLRVEILSGPAKDATLDRLLSRALKVWTRTPAASRQRAFLNATPVKLAGRPGRVTTATTARWRHHLAVIDQGQVISEERIRRRQLVTVHVYAPIPAPDHLRQDFDAVLRALILSRNTAPESVRERW